MKVFYVIGASVTVR